MFELFNLFGYNYALSDLIGNIGVLLLLGSFAGIQFEVLDPKGFWYSFNNMCVAILLGINLYYKPNLSSIIIEVVWFILSIVGLIHWYRNRSGQQTSK